MAINICQRSGSQTGTTGLVIYLQIALAPTQAPAQAYAIAFWVLAGLVAGTLLVAFYLPGAPEGAGIRNDLVRPVKPVIGSAKAFTV